VVILTVTEFARNLKSALNRVEEGREEIILVRNKRRIGKIVPGEPMVTAREAFTDLVGALPEDAAEGWIEAGRDPRTLADEAGDTWGG
jgi:antitoxin (DNA-binding transcriptional repressor) of toxin-antitoxin stability system